MYRIFLLKKNLVYLLYPGATPHVVDCQLLLWDRLSSESAQPAQFIRFYAKCSMCFSRVFRRNCILSTLSLATIAYFPLFSGGLCVLPGQCGQGLLRLYSVVPCPAGGHAPHPARCCCKTGVFLFVLNPIHLSTPLYSRVMCQGTLFMREGFVFHLFAQQCSFIFVFQPGVGGHPGVFSIFLDRAPRFFLRIFTGNFWIFLRTRCPLPKYVLGFPFSVGFFWPFSGFPSFYPHCHGVILKKMGKFLADTRFGHYHQRVA